VSQTAIKLSLYDRLLALPEGLTGEILNGQLHTQPRPSGRHAVIETGLAFDLTGPFGRGREGPGGWWIVVEPEIHFVRDTEVCVPDLAGWLRERMPRIPRDHRFEVVPNWVCEILSPSTASKDRQIKLPLYGHYGVGHAWLIDPDVRRLEAYRLDKGEWRKLGQWEGEAEVAVPPFEAVRFRLGDWWVD